MPFDTSTAKSAIKAKLLALRNNTDDPDAAADELAGMIVDSIAAQVQACIDTTVATPALVAPAGGGPVTGTITLTSSVT